MPISYGPVTDARPVPEATSNTYPFFETMEVGESVDVTVEGEDIKAVSGRLTSAARRFKKLTGRSFTLRTRPDKITIWRVE